MADGAVEREVCFRWNDITCHWSVQVEVQACRAGTDGADFFVYKLPGPPASCLRYCGSDPFATTPAATAAPPVAAPQCGLPYNTLSSYTRSIIYNDGNGATEICDDAANGTVVSGDLANNDWQGPGWYRFTGAAGDTMAMTVPSALPSEWGAFSSQMGIAHPHHFPTNRSVFLRHRRRRLAQWRVAKNGRRRCVA